MPSLTLEAVFRVVLASDRVVYKSGAKMNEFASCFSRVDYRKATERVSVMGINETVLSIPPNG